ncbi:MAG: hemagluttinin repeat-containing protein [Chlorobi bacterium OLB5]|nr:MAG: hemagluttinin repeat-containing protein [Chlorobi bacterium OLB5]
MSKYLLFAALLILIGYGSKLQAGDTDPLYALTGGDEDGTEMPADSNDALSVFSAKIKDKTVYINWRVVNPKVISYFEVLRLDPRKKEYRKINDDRIEVKDYFEKSAVSESGIVYMYDFEDEPERDGVYYYKLKGYSSAGNLVFEADEIKIGITGIKNFKVEQNTPNPFNPTTNISYELYDASYVKLKVFDLIGKEIATLVDANQTKGTYTVTFDASKYANLTSGIYFYKLETEKYSEVKKMILTK